MTFLPGTWLDLAILAVVVLASVLGAVKGLIRGFFSLLSIPAALVISFRGYRPLGKWARPLIGDGTVSLVLSFVVLLVASVVLMILLGAWVRALALRLKLGWIDGAFGTVLGASKGVLISGLILWVALGTVPKTRLLVDQSSWAGPVVGVARLVVRIVGAQLPRILPGGGTDTSHTEEV
jgi:uncharacterized membrane protein required for colicin V production